MGLRHIEMKDRILIGQTLVKGHGVGTDNAMGAKITFDEIDTIISAIDKKGSHDVDAFMIVAGLGGGTGSGGSPVLARSLKKIYREPVYVLGILPAPEEGRLYTYNAARSLMTLVNEADNTFLFDNNAWKNEGESVKNAYKRLNDEIVRRFGVLFRAGEVGKMGVGEMVVDSSEIINTLRGGGIRLGRVCDHQCRNAEIPGIRRGHHRGYPGNPEKEGDSRGGPPWRGPDGKGDLPGAEGSARQAHAPLRLFHG